MSSQYEQAASQRYRSGSAFPNWLILIVVGFLSLCVFILGISLYSASSGVNDLNTEFQKTLFEQSNEMLEVNYLLLNKQDRNARYFSKLNKYSDQINHRFAIISEYIEDNNLAVDQSRFAKAEKLYQNKLAVILNKRKALIGYHRSLLKMEQTLPKMLAQNTEINNQLFKSNSSTNHIYFITRQLFLIERITTNVRVLGANLSDPSFIVTAADRMGRDMALLIKVYRGLLKGDYKMNVSKVNNLKIRDELNKVNKLAKTLSKEVSVVLQNGPEAFQFIEMRNGLRKKSFQIQKDYQMLFF